MSGLLGFWQERRAATRCGGFSRSYGRTATVVREAPNSEVPVENVIPGDIVRLAAGRACPAIRGSSTARDLFVDRPR